MRAMLELLRDLVAHKGYADAAMLGAVSHCDGAVAEADLLALFRHMLIANRFWLLSAAGLPFVYEQESEPQASLDEVVSRFRATHEQERDWIAAATDAYFDQDDRNAARPRWPLLRGAGADAAVPPLARASGAKRQAASRPRRNPAGERFHRVGGRASGADMA